MSKETCPAGIDCPQFIQEGCDTVHQLYGEYPCNEEFALYMEPEIKAVCRQVQQQINGKDFEG